MTSKLWTTANKGIQDPSEKKLDGPGGFGGFGVVFVGFLMLLPTFPHFPPTSLYFSLLLTNKNQARCAKTSSQQPKTYPPPTLTLMGSLSP